MDDAELVLTESQPDAILLDILNPESAARDMETIRRLSSAPVMIVSGWGDAERLQAMAPGADSYLPKPFDPDRLSDRVTALLGRARALREQSEANVQRALQARERVLRARALFLQKYAEFMGLTPQR